MRKEAEGSMLFSTRCSDIGRPGNEAKTKTPKHQGLKKAKTLDKRGNSAARLSKCAQLVDNHQDNAGSMQGILIPFLYRLVFGTAISAIRNRSLRSRGTPFVMSELGLRGRDWLDITSMNAWHARHQSLHATPG